MSIFGRVADILQAKTHKLLEQLEDPNETLDLSYEKMITGLQETKLHLADVVAQQKSLERQIEAADREARKRRGRRSDGLAGQPRRSRQGRAGRTSSRRSKSSPRCKQAHAAIVPQAQKLIDTEKKLEDADREVPHCKKRS